MADSFSRQYSKEKFITPKIKIFIDVIDNKSLKDVKGDGHHGQSIRKSSTHRRPLPLLLDNSPRRTRARRRAGQLPNAAG